MQRGAQCVNFYHAKVTLTRAESFSGRKVHFSPNAVNEAHISYETTGRVHANKTLGYEPSTRKSEMISRAQKIIKFALPCAD